ncbi:hypothetical protein Ahy_B06g084582 [Arachis hypogaea]|uniref:SWIM-type domain-containing protein n=1 Tax=Arachis hypogaea TaxID=3818 RepID=A0A444YSB6_ARAHY|nr:hypothetical protein Ahy_B06g084582 [Arachis hypogaea]
MPCVHVCAALARASKRPYEFCHKWLTIEAYNDIYAFYINPIPGHTKRNCAKKDADEEEVAATEAAVEATAAANGGCPTILLQLDRPPKLLPKRKLSKGTKFTSGSNNPSASIPPAATPLASTNHQGIIHLILCKFGQPMNGLSGLESVLDYCNTGLDPHPHNSGKRESLFLVILLIMLPKDRRLFELPAALLALAIIVWL